jgi:diguanylate cyclase (GGDEF)-like protein
VITIAVPSFLPMYSAAMFIVNLLLAILLFAKGSIEARRDITQLGAAYLFVCLIIIPHTASFPGGFMPTALIGTPVTTPWLWSFWHLGFALGVLRYAAMAGQPPRPGALWRPVVIVLAVTGAATLFSVFCAPFLPPVAYLQRGTVPVIPVTVIVMTIAATVRVARLKAATAEQLWVAVGMVAVSVDVWLTLYGSARFALGWYVAKAAALLGSLVVLSLLMHEITRLYRDVANANRTLAILATRDGLTGLANRRHFDTFLEAAFDHAQRLLAPVALILLDVDFFKKYNDRYGHQAGDECLRQVSRAAGSVLLRPGDLIARYGGEEIVVVLPGTDEGGAELVAERMRAAVEALRIEHLDSPHGVVTVSVGFSAIIPGRLEDTAAQLLGAADAALYRAKQSGRNRVGCG